MNHNKENQHYYSSLTGARRAVPIILFALGAFIALCFFTASTGIMGGAISSLLLGLFSYGAYAIPPLLILHGIFYPSDHAKSRTLSRFIFSAATVICISVLVYTVFYMRSDPKPAFTPGDYYAMGTDGVGGGFIGSTLAYGVIKVFGSVGLIIITCAVFAIYVAYFFTDGHGVIGKICLAIITFFASVGAFIERKIKSAFGKVKEAKDEKSKRISVAKSRDLSDDEFFMVENGMQDFAIPDLGIKETRSAESVEESPMLHDKVRPKSAIDADAEDDRHRLNNVRIIEEDKPKQEQKPRKRKKIHSDFDLDDTITPTEHKRDDDIIYDDPTKPNKDRENSADSVFTQAFDPFDLSANEKLAAKPSSKKEPNSAPTKERVKFSEDIFNITPEDVERARKQAEFEMKKRTIIDMYEKKDTASPEAEPAESTSARTEDPRTYSDMAERTKCPEDLFNDGNGSDVNESRADETPAPQSTYISFGSSDASDSGIRDTVGADAYGAQPSYADESKARSSYERVARFSDIITEYSTAEAKAKAEGQAVHSSAYESVREAVREPVYEAAKEPEYEPVKEPVYEPVYEPVNEPTYGQKEEPVRIEEYKAPSPAGDMPTFDSREQTREEAPTLTVEREIISPFPDDIYSDSEDAGEQSDDSDIDSDGIPEEEYGSDEPEIIPEEQRNPKIDEYRSMFPILDSDSSDSEDGESDEGGLIFEREPTEDNFESDDGDDGAYAEPEDEETEEYEEEEPEPMPEPEPEPPKPKKPDYSNYKFPPIDILSADEAEESFDCQAEMEENANKLIETLESFKVKASIKGVDRGPRITRYEIVPATGVKVSSIMSLQNDIALNLAAEGIRMEAPIPGKSAIGFELPNRKPSIVKLRGLLETEEFKNAKSKTLVCIGKDVTGCPEFGDIAKMPHVLIAGATGMGKSVCINSIMISMLYKARPDEVKFIMIDPKKVEFAMYNGIPHLLIPVVTDPKQAAGALMWAVEQMEKRYEMIEKMRVRNIDMYNDKVAKDPSLGEPMPKIVVVIDELNELMLTVRDPVENLIMSIAQKARAAGIHLIIGTQRPSVDVITGVIKANIPSRIACKVMSNTDSRTILDQKGAEDLLDKGDMLFFPVGKPKPIRVQGAFVSDGEVEEIMEFLKAQGGSENYDSDAIEEIARNAQKCSKKSSDSDDGDDGDGDDNGGYLNDQKFLDAVNVAVTTGKISTSLLQRKLSIGYGKAAKYVDIMEDMGIVSESNGQKARDVLITKDEWHEKLARISLDD